MSATWGISVLRAGVFAGCVAAAATASGGPRKTSHAKSIGDAKERQAEEVCGLFLLTRAPTVSAKKVGALVTHGNTPEALATVHNDKTLVLAMKVGDIDSELGPALCKRIGKGPFLFHAWKEKGHLVGELYVPTAAPDRKHDAQVLCEAQELGQKLFSDRPASEHLAFGMQESMGSLTTAEYRGLVARAMREPDQAGMALIKSVDKDIRAVGDAAWDRCALLVKK